MPDSAKLKRKTIIEDRESQGDSAKPVSSNADMSKLSEPLKALINAAHSKPHTLPAPRQIGAVYSRFADDAGKRKVGLTAWLTASVRLPPSPSPDQQVANLTVHSQTAATMTMNSPDSLLELYALVNSPQHASKTGNPQHGVYTAELMREVGLKNIGLNGVPRTINCLGAFFGGLPSNIQSELRKRPARRNLTPNNIEDVVKRGDFVWNSVYHPFSDKLVEKLAISHPDLPIFIKQGEYGALFSDPKTPDLDPAVRPNVGRVLMSILAVATLRTQTGVGPQVLSHVFGLRKAYEDGTAAAEPEVEGGQWLGSDEGSVWLIEHVDRIVAALGDGAGSGFAPGMTKEPKAKL